MQSSAAPPKTRLATNGILLNTHARKCMNKNDLSYPHNLKVAGSNPAPATNRTERVRGGGGSVGCCPAWRECSDLPLPQAEAGADQGGEDEDDGE
jgi:hypothetical protein